MAGKTMVVSETITIPGITPYQRGFTLTSGQNVESEISVPAAKTGQLTTRTNATDGVITLDAGHGLSTGALDVFWNGGSRSQVAATIATNACTITGGSGDDLPANLTSVTVASPTSEDFVFTGDNAVGAFVYSNLGSTPTTTDWNGYVYFTLSDNTVVATFKLTAAISSGSWDGAAVSTNPFAGAAITKVKYTQGNTAARTMGAVALYN